MPYGYEQYRLNQQISPNTLLHEIRLINKMLSFINQKYNKPVEPHEIRPVDIREFLDYERSTDIQDTTVNRKLSQIRQWFNYMWESGKIQIDFMPKFKYADKLDLKNTTNIKLNYGELLLLKSTLLKDPKLTITAKLFFIFYMRGLRLRDIVLITVENIYDQENVLTVQVESKSGYDVFLTFEEDEEISILLTAIERAIFRGSPYLFSSKIGEEYVPFRNGSVSVYITALTNYIGTPFRSGDLRIAYVHYLHIVKGLKIDEIQSTLGISLDTASRLLKDSLERMNNVEYNMNRI